MDLPPRFNFTSFPMRLSSEDDSGLSSASPESGVFPVELDGDVPSLNKSPVFASEFTIDQGRGLFPITGVDFSLSCFKDSESSKKSIYFKFTKFCKIHELLKHYSPTINQ